MHPDSYVILSLSQSVYLKKKCKKKKKKRITTTTTARRRRWRRFTYWRFPIWSWFLRVVLNLPVMMPGFCSLTALGMLLLSLCTGYHQLNFEEIFNCHCNKSAKYISLLTKASSNLKEQFQRPYSFPLLPKFVSFLFWKVWIC